MATETGPDLSFAQAMVESLMDDSCVVLEDFDQSAWQVDPNTLELIPTAGTATVVYAGPVKFSSPGASQFSWLGGAPVATNETQVDFPLEFIDSDGLQRTTPIFTVGQTIIISSSRRDPKAVGKAFRVMAVAGTKTLAVKRSVLAHLITEMTA